MKEELIEILAGFGYPVRLQGSLAQDEDYPDSFFTIWNNETFDGAYYDNEPIKYVWDFTINFYSTDPSLVNSVLVQTKGYLKDAGWIVSGKGYDVPSDEVTHTGRAIDAIYVERDYIESHTPMDKIPIDSGTVTPVPYDPTIKPI